MQIFLLIHQLLILVTLEERASTVVISTLKEIVSWPSCLLAFLKFICLKKAFEGHFNLKKMHHHSLQESSEGKLAFTVQTLEFSKLILWYQLNRNSPIFTEALLIIAKRWNQPKCPLMDEWINKVWYIHTMEYYSALKRKQI